MADITLSITVKDAIVSDVVDSLCDTYGEPIEGQTKNQKAKDIVRDFIKDCYINWKTTNAAGTERTTAKANADTDINN